MKLCTECKTEFEPKRIGLKVTKQCSKECESINKKKLPKKIKVKKMTLPKIKAKLWKEFSLHQKLTASRDGVHCNCYTCGAVLEIGTVNCQGGHCLPKSVYRNLYFDERAVRPQCYQCNINHGGMHYDFCEKLKDEIGLSEFEYMKLCGKDVVKKSISDYEELIKEYKNKNSLLLSKCKDM